MNRLRWFWLLALLASCKPAVEDLSHHVVAEHPHDAACYTQGLEFHDGQLLESSGQYGGSSVRRVDPLTGEVLKRRDFPDAVFAEGLTVLNGELWVLTWKNQQAYVLDPHSLELIRRHRYEGEGWGLTNDGSRLIMSDGSSRIRFRDPGNFALIETIEVTQDGRPLDQINELEWVDGAIWANLYGEDRIVRIDAQSGEVTATIELGGLRGRLPDQQVAVEEFNGIARHPTTGRWWVTGKYWPLMFELAIPKP